ncbi:MAG: glycine betaine ABC transporter substrate-binding protein [Leucobacter sp.]
MTLGYLPGWTDGLSLAYLLDDQLGKLGYDIEMEELGEASLLYTGLAEGDVNIYTSAAPEKTHASYMDEYGDQIEDLATYYDNGVLTFAVPEYMEDVNSIADLKGQADRFDGEIIGIEPSAGLTERTLEHVMPDYGLEGEYELVTSSTASMLATLKSKIDSEEDVVVTLWRPFWANSEFPVKDLEDPKGSMGDPEGYHILGNLGFSDEFPEAAEYIANIHLDDDAYGSLEGLITSDEYADDREGAVDVWLEDHADAYPGLLTD